MTHSVLCFLCKQNEAEPGDLCAPCEGHISGLHVQAEFEFVTANNYSPMRDFVEQVMVPVFGSSR
jgi:hypothetical protein